jgi:hypothetical protein
LTLLKDEIHSSLWRDILLHLGVFLQLTHVFSLASKQTWGEVRKVRYIAATLLVRAIVVEECGVVCDRYRWPGIGLGGVLVFRFDGDMVGLGLGLGGGGAGELSRRACVDEQQANSCDVDEPLQLHVLEYSGLHCPLRWPIHGSEDAWRTRAAQVRRKGKGKVPVLYR